MLDDYRKWIDQQVTRSSRVAGSNSPRSRSTPSRLATTVTSIATARTTSDQSQRLPCRLRRTMSAATGPACIFARCSGVRMSFLLAGIGICQCGHSQPNVAPVIRA
jgi:hypothetical protein